MILEFLLAVIAVEAITELVVKSEIFNPVREFFFNRKKIKIFKFIHGLLDCGYCTSVWTGWLIAYIVFSNNLFGWFLLGLVLHRASNVLHIIIDLIYNAEYIMFKDKVVD